MLTHLKFLRRFPMACVMIAMDLLLIAALIFAASHLPSLGAALCAGGAFVTALLLALGLRRYLC